MCLSDAFGKPRIALVGRTKGDAALAIYDEEKRIRSVVGITADIPGVKLYDNDGNEMWGVPLPDMARRC